MASLPRASPIMLDIISINAIILTIMLMIYAATWKDPGMMMETNVSMYLMISGLVLAMLLGLIRPMGVPRGVQSKQIIIWLIICLGVVYILNWSTTWKTMETTALSIGAISFAVLIAVSETIFFGGFIQAWLIKLVGPLMGIFMGAAVFSIYHLQVLGLDINSLLIVFGAGVVLGWAMYQTKSLTAPLLAHVLVNFIGLGGFLYGGPVASFVVIAFISVLLLILLKPKRGGISV